MGADLYIRREIGNRPKKKQGRRYEGFWPPLIYLRNPKWNVCLAQRHRMERCEKRKSNQFWNPLLAGDAVVAGKAPTKRASSAARSAGIDSTEAKTLLSRNQNEKVEDGSEEGTSPVGIHLSSTEGQTAIRLPVVRAMAHGEKGKKKLDNCLLDTGSERSLIRNDVANM
ncbi:hypothetical protein T08_16130 [Trichinella sp. T8]|nr:hypothetical protein T08_16130 [Trichinella sp. T8]